MSLERRYRRLVRAFPMDWRRRHEEDLVLTLLSGAKPGQRRPSLADTADLVLSGLKVRLSSGSPLVLILSALTGLVVVTFAVDAAITPTSLTFLVTSLLVVLAPGTGVIYSVSIAVSSGWRLGSLAAIGCTLGIVPHLLAATVGLSGLMQASAEAFEIVRWAGVAYLAYLGVEMIRSSSGLADFAEPVTTAGGGQVIRRGVLINLLNPKLTVFFFAFLPQFLDSPPGFGDVRLIGLSAVFMAMTLAIFLCYSALAAQVRTRVLGRDRLVRRIGQSLGILLIGFAARLAVAER